MPPTPPARPANINDYAPPKLGLGWVVLIAVVTAVVIGTLFFLTSPAKVVQPAATATPSPTPTPTPTWGMPFVTADEFCTGQWDIVSSSWIDDGLEIQVRVVSDNCPLVLTFSAYDKETAWSHEPIPGPGLYEMGALRMAAGDDRTGTLFFRMERVDVTVMMTDDSFTQLSAIDVDA
jgi:hypothetical protein